MSQSRTWAGFPFDLLVGVVFGLAAIWVTVSPVSRLVRLLVGVLFLLFVPGYTVTVALFPRAIPWNTTGDIGELDGLFPFDRLLLSVALSTALAVIIGINIEFTPWDITAQTVSTGLFSLTLIAATVGAIRRYRIGTWKSESRARLGEWGRSLVAFDSATLARLMVVLAVTASLLSVAVAAGPGDRGEQYTEFGLLTENESGTLVAEGHPSNLTVNESTSLYYTITNREGRDQAYSIIVQLQAVTPDGEVVRTAELNRFDTTLAAGEATRRNHTITPAYEGERLRVQYLLYTNEPPARPTASNAYRHVHIWVDVSRDSLGNP